MAYLLPHTIHQIDRICQFEDESVINIKIWHILEGCSDELYVLEVLQRSYGVNMKMQSN